MQRASLVLALLPLTLAALAVAYSVGLGGANLPQGLDISYVSSSPTFVLPVNNQGYSAVTVTVTVDGQATNVTLPPYSYKLVDVQLEQGLNVITLGNEKLYVNYTYDADAADPTAIINGSQYAFVTSAKPGQSLIFVVTANIPNNDFLEPIMPVTDMEVGPEYSTFYQLVPPNEVIYGVTVPQGIAQGLYTVYFPIEVEGYVKAGNTYVQKNVGFTWALAIINVSYGLSPFSNTNSTRPFGTGELAQFVVPGFNPYTTYYVDTTSGNYKVGLMSGQYNVFGYSAAVSYFGSSQLEVAIGANGIVVYIPNYSGPVQLSTSPVIITTTSTTSSTTTTSSTSSTSTTASTTTTMTTSSTTTTTSTTSSTTSSTTTTTSTTTVTTTSSTTSSVTSTQTTPPTVTVPVSSSSSTLTYVVIGVIVIIVVVAAVLLLRR